MKFSAAFVAAAVAGFAAAQDQCLSVATAIPSCGQSCLTVAGSSYGCVYTDFACQCSHQSQINNQALTSCVLSACSGDAQQALGVSSSAIALCSCVSANAGSGGSGSGSSAATTTASVPATTAAMSGGSGSGSSSAKSAAGGSTAKASSAPLSVFTGGAPTGSGALGGIFAGILGLVAAL